MKYFIAIRDSCNYRIRKLSPIIEAIIGEKKYFSQKHQMQWSGFFLGGGAGRLASYCDDWMISLFGTYLMTYSPPSLSFLPLHAWETNQKVGCQNNCQIGRFPMPPTVFMNGHFLFVSCLLNVKLLIPYKEIQNVDNYLCLLKMALSPIIWDTFYRKYLILQKLWAVHRFLHSHPHSKPCVIN